MRNPFEVPSFHLGAARREQMLTCQKLARDTYLPDLPNVLYSRLEVCFLPPRVLKTNHQLRERHIIICLMRGRIETCVTKQHLMHFIVLLHHPLL